MTSQSRNAGLDIARAMAITLVLMAHFFKYFDWLGGIGVDLFFVLSGFLIGGILIRQIEADPAFLFAHLKQFWIRRWFRTVPSYFLFLAINVVLALVHLRSNLSLADFWKFPFFLQNFAWSRPEFFGESWSLAVEEWFYLLFPLAVFLLNRKIRFSFSTAIALFLLLPISLRFFSLSILDFKDHPRQAIDFIRTTVIFRLDALMFGVLAARLARYHLKAWDLMRRLVWPATALVLLMMWLESHLSIVSQFPLLGPLMVSLSPLGFAVLLPSFIRASFGPGRYAQIAQGFVEKISLWSYSIYLCHLPLIAPLQAYFGSSVVEWGGLGATLMFRLAIVAAVIGLSGLLYNFFEKPTTRLRERFHFK